MKKHYIEILLHIVFWITSFWIFNETLSIETQEINEINGERWVKTARSYPMFFFMAWALLAKAVLAYTNIFGIFPAFFYHKNIWRYFGQLGLLLIGVIFLEACFHFIITQITDYPSFHFFKTAIGFNLMLYFFYTCISVAYSLGKERQKNEKIRQQLVAENLKTELNYLKSQINPHFLLNTLNNLYAIAERHENTELIHGISELSNLMRYMLYEGKAEQVLLQKELDFLKSIIEIQQLRIAEDDDVLIGFQIEGAVAQKKIAPLILVPFVENAFKHGIHFKKSSFIKIKTQLIDNQLVFTVSNSNFPVSSSDLNPHSGIGLKNVQRRLALLYPQQHHLDIQETKDIFKIKLKLDL